MDPSHLAALYNAAPIILWVEDLVTSVYLQTLWRHDRRFQLYVGGGHEVLSAVVESARRMQLSHVYCLRDRDFGPTNRLRWKEPDVSTFALETFELECFLLDPAALASCAINTAGKTEEWLDDHLRARAQTLLWWMACRKVLAGLREARQAKFPSHPKRGQVATQADAERVVLDNEWVMATAPGLPEKVASERLRADLHDAHSYYAGLFQQERDTWTRAFSGKELVEELVSWIFTKGRPPGSAALQDLAKAVAQEQLSSGNAPAELLELREAMLERLSSAASPS